MLGNAILGGVVAVTIACGASALAGGSDCCVANGTPGCDDPTCESNVCAVDPFCCDEEWDVFCAAEAANFCADLCSGPVPDCPPATNDCFTTSGAPGCSDEACCAIVCAADPFCCETAWDGLCVSGAQTLCAPPSGDIECPDGASDEGEACGDDDNGGCNSDIPIFGSIACGETICGTAWATGGTRDTDWYEITLTERTEIAFSGTAAFPLVIGIVNTGGVADCAAATALSPFATAGPFSTASLTACLNPGTYWFFVSVNGFEGAPCGGENNDYVVTLECLGDCTGTDCEDATAIGLGDTAFSTVGAQTSTPPLPPECDEGFGVAFVNDIWFSFVATQTDVLTVSTCNQASFDTRLAAYTGDCDNLVLEACNDDGPACAGFTSLMEFPTTTGTTYFIRVGGFGGSGTGTLSLFYGTAPGLPNDDCADATVITDGVSPFSTVGATTDGPDLPAECDEGFGLSLVNDVWFSYTATCNGTIIVSTCGSATFDTRLAAYTGSCDNLTLVACNDDAAGCATFTSIMEWEGICGETYLIRIGGFAATGSGQLSVACDGDCDGGPEPCPWDLSGDGQVDGSDLGLLLESWGNPFGGAELGQLLEAWGACP